MTIMLWFLQYFAHEISKPVADHNPEDYIPTQFITGYFKNSLKRYKADGSKDAIDGILYDSSKVDDAYNAVLFLITQRVPSISDSMDTH